MLPSPIKTFWSLTHAFSTLRNILSARAMPSLTAASNPSGEVALISVTVATLVSCVPVTSLRFFAPLFGSVSFMVKAVRNRSGRSEERPIAA